ncbi:hypothetical protein GQR58_007142 [Nymphon striatum]|nr:hypothetical protein GQR58_007142 [Nymphon striatum]
MFFLRRLWRTEFDRLRQKLSKRVEGAKARPRCITEPMLADNIELMSNKNQDMTNNGDVLFCVDGHHESLAVCAAENYTEITTDGYDFTENLNEEDDFLRTGSSSMNHLKALHRRQKQTK